MEMFLFVQILGTRIWFWNDYWECLWERWLRVVWMFKQESYESKGNQYALDVGSQRQLRW